MPKIYIHGAFDYTQQAAEGRSNGRLDLAMTQLIENVQKAALSMVELGKWEPDDVYVRLVEGGRSSNRAMTCVDVMVFSSPDRTHELLMKFATQIKSAIDLVYAAYRAANSDLSEWKIEVEVRTLNRSRDVYI